MFLLKAESVFSAFIKQTVVESLAFYYQIKALFVG